MTHIGTYYHGVGWLSSANSEDSGHLSRLEHLIDTIEFGIHFANQVVVKDALLEPEVLLIETLGWNAVLDIAQQLDVVVELGIWQNNKDQGWLLFGIFVHFPSKKIMVSENIIK